jgi:hypothetical protein
VPAASLERILHQIGWTFVLCLLFSVRIDGRPVLLALQAAAMAWQLRRLEPFAASPGARRAWQQAMTGAGACVVIGVVGLVPAVSPGLVNVLGTVPLLSGMSAYAALLGAWAYRSAWTDVGAAFDRATRWILASMAVVAVGVGLLIAFGERTVDGSDGDLLLGRTVDGWQGVVGVVVLLVVWVGSVISLQRANRLVRAGLRTQPDAVIDLA